MSEPSRKKGDKTEENSDYNTETILGSMTTTTSAQSMDNFKAMLNKILHNDTNSSSNDRLDLESNEIKETRPLLRRRMTSSSSLNRSIDQSIDPPPSNDQLVTDTASYEGKYLFNYVLRHE